MQLQHRKEIMSIWLYQLDFHLPNGVISPVQEQNIFCLSYHQRKGSSWWNTSIFFVFKPSRQNLIFKELDVAYLLRKPQNYSIPNIYFRYVQTFLERCNLYTKPNVPCYNPAKDLVVLILSFKSPIMLDIMEYKTKQSYWHEVREYLRWYP